MKRYQLHSTYSLGDDGLPVPWVWDNFGWRAHRRLFAFPHFRFVILFLFSATALPVLAPSQQFLCFGASAIISFPVYVQWAFHCYLVTNERPQRAKLFPINIDKWQISCRLTHIRLVLLFQTKHARQQRVGAVTCFWYYFSHTRGTVDFKIKRPMRQVAKWSEPAPAARPWIHFLSQST